MAAKVISFSLDKESIARAVRELNEYIDEVKRLLGELVKKLTEEGVHISTVKISELGAVDTGELSDSMYAEYDEQTHVGFIRSKAFYAFYVEYGTGIVGSKGPHPDGGTYDVNNHGEAGWSYIATHRDGKLHWTKGQISRPFLYETRKELERRAQAAFSEVFNGTGR